MFQGVDNGILVRVDCYRATQHDPETRALLPAKYHEWVDGIAALMDTLQARGWVAPEKDPQQTARHIIALHEGWHVFACRRGECPDADTDSRPRAAALVRARRSAERPSAGCGYYTT
jgi:phosphoglycolate phosphatase-like HAD superfamily hydrolase